MNRSRAIRSTVTYSQTPVNTEALFDLLDSIHEELVFERVMLAERRAAYAPSAMATDAGGVLAELEVVRADMAALETTG